MSRSLTAVPLGKAFLNSPIAHRGLHDCNGSFGSGRTENSSAAFEAAITAGYGIEIDIQLSADKVAIVFHDDTLDRLFDINEKVSDLSLNVLKNFRLENGQKILTFDEFLELVSGRVPVLVELKDQSGFLDDSSSDIEDVVAESLRKYSGPIAIMSFNPNSVWLFGQRLPNIPRGLVTEDFKKCDWPALNVSKLEELRRIKGLQLVAASFISHKHSDLVSKYVARLPSNINILSWTVRNNKELELALNRSDNITFEGFRPPQRIAS